MGKKQSVFWKRYQMPLVMVVLGIVLMMSGRLITHKAAGVPTESMPGTNAEIMGTHANTNTQTDTRLELEIEALLCDIPGVKAASVIVTYEDSGRQQVEKDETIQTDETKEEDGQGGNRTVQSEQKQETTIYVEDAEGNRYPFVQTETYGTVRGVAVVIKGTYDDGIREKIVRTLEVLLDVPTHKIQVIW